MNQQYRTSVDGQKTPENKVGVFSRSPEAVDMFNRVKIVDNGVYVMGSYVDRLPVIQTVAKLAQPSTYVEAVGKVVDAVAEFKKPIVATDSVHDTNGSRFNSPAQSVTTQPTTTNVNDNSLQYPASFNNDANVTKTSVELARERLIQATATQPTTEELLRQYEG